MSKPATLAMLNLDCARPQVLAEFYHQVLGWEVTHSQDEYAMITDGTTSIGFGRIDDHRPPPWPNTAESPKRYHLDLMVDDLDEAERRILGHGATRPDHQPGETWRVLLDPEGHPFCICARH